MLKKFKIVGATVASVATAAGLTTGLVVGLDNTSVPAQQTKAASLAADQSTQRPWAANDNLYNAGYAQYETGGIKDDELDDLMTDAMRFLPSVGKPWLIDPTYVELLYDLTDNGTTYVWLKNHSFQGKTRKRTFDVVGSVAKFQQPGPKDRLVLNYVTDPSYGGQNMSANVVYHLTDQKVFRTSGLEPNLPVSYVAGAVASGGKLTLADPSEVVTPRDDEYKIASNLAVPLDLGRDILNELFQYEEAPTIRFIPDTDIDNKLAISSVVQVSSKSGKVAYYAKTGASFVPLTKGKLVFTYFQRSKYLTEVGNPQDIVYELEEAPSATSGVPLHPWNLANQVYNAGYIKTTSRGITDLELEYAMEDAVRFLPDVGTEWAFTPRTLRIIYADSSPAGDYVWDKSHHFSSNGNERTFQIESNVSAFKVPKNGDKMVLTFDAGTSEPGPIDIVASVVYVMTTKDVLRGTGTEPNLPKEYDEAATKFSGPTIVLANHPEDDTVVDQNSYPFASNLIVPLDVAKNSLPDTQAYDPVPLVRYVPNGSAKYVGDSIIFAKSQNGQPAYFVADTLNTAPLTAGKLVFTYFVRSNNTAKSGNAVDVVCDLQEAPVPVQGADVLYTPRSDFVEGVANDYVISNMTSFLPAVNQGYQSWQREAIWVINAATLNQKYPYSSKYKLRLGDVIWDSYVANPLPGLPSLKPYRVYYRYEVTRENVDGVNDAAVIRGSAQSATSLRYENRITLRAFIAKTQAALRRLGSLYEPFNLVDIKAPGAGDLAAGLAIQDQDPSVNGGTYTITFTAAPTALNAYRKPLTYVATMAISSSTATLQGSDQTVSYGAPLLPGLGTSYDLTAHHPVLPAVNTGYDAWQRQPLTLKKASGATFTYYPGTPLEQGDEVYDTYSAEPIGAGTLTLYTYTLKYSVGQPTQLQVANGALDGTVVSLSFATPRVDNLDSSQVQSELLAKLSELRTLYYGFAFTSVPENQAVPPSGFIYKFVAIAQPTDITLNQKPMRFDIDYVVSPAPPPAPSVQGSDYAATYDQPLVAGLGQAYNFQTAPSQLAPPPVNQGYAPWERSQLAVVSASGQRSLFLGQPLNVGDTVLDVYTAKPLPNTAVTAYTYTIKYAVTKDAVPDVNDASLASGFVVSNTSQDYDSSVSVRDLFEKSLEKLDALPSLYGDAVSYQVNNQSFGSVLSALTYAGSLRMTPGTTYRFIVVKTPTALNRFTAPVSFNFTFAIVAAPFVQGTDTSVTYSGKPLAAGFVNAYNLKDHPTNTPPPVNVGYAPWQRNLYVVYASGAKALYPDSVLNVGDTVVDKYEALPLPNTMGRVYSYTVSYPITASSVDLVNDATLANGSVSISTTVKNEDGLTLRKLIDRATSRLSGLGALYTEFSVYELSSSKSHNTLGLLTGADNAVPTAGETYVISLIGNPTALNSHANSFVYTFTYTVLPSVPVAPASFKYTVQDDLSLVSGLSTSLNVSVPLDEGYTTSSVYSLTLVEGSGYQHDVTSSPQSALNGVEPQLVTVYKVEGPGKEPYYVKVVSKNHSFYNDTNKILVSEDSIIGTGESFDLKLPLVGDGYASAWTLEGMYGRDWNKGGLFAVNQAWVDAAPSGTQVLLRFVLKATVDTKKDIYYEVHYNLVHTPKDQTGGTPDQSVPGAVRYNLDDYYSWIQGLSSAPNVTVPMDPGYTSARIVSIIHRDIYGTDKDITSDPTGPTASPGGDVITTYEVTGVGLPSYKVVVKSVSRGYYEANGFLTVDIWKASGPLSKYNSTPELPLAKLSSDYSDTWYVNNVFFVNPSSGALGGLSVNDLYQLPKGSQVLIRYVAPKLTYGSSVLYNVYYTIT